MHRIDENDKAFIGNDVIGWVPDVRGENGKINPHLTRFITKHGTYRDLFHVKPIYYEHRDGSWRPLSEVCTHYGVHEVTFRYDRLHWVHPRYLRWLNKKLALHQGSGEYTIASPFGVYPSNWLVDELQHTLALPRIGCTTLTEYPEPSTGTAPMDGAFIRITGSEMFSTIHDGAGTHDTFTDSTGNFVELRAISASNRYNVLTRYGLGFDTSSIGSDTISSATCSLHANSDTADNDFGENPEVDLVSFTPSTGSESNFDDADFVHIQWGTTVYASETVDDFRTSEGSYHDWDLNASGLSYINTSGNTMFGFRLEWDTDDSFGGTWASNDESRINCHFADESGTSSDPKLVVEHAAGGGSSFTPKVIMF